MRCYECGHEEWRERFRWWCLKQLHYWGLRRSKGSVDGSATNYTQIMGFPTLTAFDTPFTTMLLSLHTSAPPKVRWFEDELMPMISTCRIYGALWSDWKWVG